MLNPSEPSHDTGKDRSSSRSSAAPTTTTTTRLNNTITLTPASAPTTATATTTFPSTITTTTTTTTSTSTTAVTTPSPTTTTTTTTTPFSSTTTTLTMSSSKKDGGGGGGGGGGTRDLFTEARNFTSSLSNVFLMKKRDQQSRHLLEKAQFLIEALLAEHQRLQAPARAVPVAPRQPRSAGTMGQLWVKLDELKRENDDLRRQRGRSQDDRSSSSPKEKVGPGEVIINDLHKTKTDNESLKMQVAQLQKALREFQGVNASMQDEYKRSKAALDAAQRSVEKSRHDYRKLEATFTALRAENEALKLKLTVASSPAKSNMAAPMPRSDNRLTENISERCRPSTIALRYNSLESQQWIDAKEALEDDPQAEMEEDNIVGLLCEGLMSAYAASQRLFSNVELVISELLRRPTLATSVIENRLVANGQCNPMPGDLADIIKYRLRQTTDNVDTDVICSMAQEHQSAETRQALQMFSTSKVVLKYLKECAQVTWQMALQNPPMRLVADDNTFDDVRHKLWWSCDQSRARNVDLFVWPVLFDYEGGNILVKGCVCAS